MGCPTPRAPTIQHKVRNSCRRWSKRRYRLRRNPSRDRRALPESQQKFLGIAFQQDDRFCKEYFAACYVNVAFQVLALGIIQIDLAKGSADGVVLAGNGS